MTAKESPAAPQTLKLLDLQIAIQALPCVHPGTVPQLQTAYEAGHRHALRQAAEFVAERLAAPALPVTILTDERIDALWHTSINFPADTMRWRHFARLLASSASLEPQQEHVFASPDSVGEHPAVPAGTGSQLNPATVAPTEHGVSLLVFGVVVQSWVGAEKWTAFANARADSINAASRSRVQGGNTSDNSAIATPSIGAVPAADRNAVLEEAAQLLLNGSFMHDQSPAKLFAAEASKAIRALKSATPPATAEQTSRADHEHAVIAMLPEILDKLAAAHIAGRQRPDETGREYAARIMRDWDLPDASIAQPVAPVAAMTDDEQIALLVVIEDYMERTDYHQAQSHPQCLAAEEAIYSKVSEFMAKRAAASPVPAPVAVSEWLKAETASREAIEAYNAAVAESDKHIWPGTDINAEFQVMSVAKNKAFHAMRAMYDVLSLATPTGQSNQTCQHVPMKDRGGPNDDEVTRCAKCGEYLSNQTKGEQ